MTQYQKSQGIRGAWVKGKDVVDGTRCVLVSEVRPIASQFRDKNDNIKMQDVGKVKFEGKDEPVNISLNRATIDALVDAFGEDSADWMNQPLITETEKVAVAGKRVTVVYLLPEGYELQEDEGGYVKIVNPNKVASDDSEMAEANGDIQAAADEELEDPFPVG